MRLAFLIVSFVFVCYVSHSADSPTGLPAGIPSLDTNAFAGTNFSIHLPGLHAGNIYLLQNTGQNDRTKYAIQSLKPSPAVNYCLQIARPNPGTNYLIETIHP
jgi:hypothetical protein